MGEEGSWPGGPDSETKPQWPWFWWKPALAPCPGPGWNVCVLRSRGLIGRAEGTFPLGDQGTTVSLPDQRKRKGGLSLLAERQPEGRVILTG